MKLLTFRQLVLLCLLGSLSAFSTAGGKHQYKVTITNITKAQSFTPFIVATHKPGVSIYSLGEPASPELGDIAEGGNTGPLDAVLSSSSKVKDIAHSEGLLMAGQSLELMVSGKGRHNRLSLAAMLLPTNDTIVALNSVYLPRYGKSTVYAKAYDAGTETNDELCMSIPGPLCGGEPFSPNDEGEGFVHVASGIHGMGDIDAALYDWRGAVAKITIERVR